MGYLLIIAISVAVGVAVYRMTDTVAVAEADPETWAGAGQRGAGCGAGARPAPDQLRAALDRARPPDLARSDHRHAWASWWSWRSVRPSLAFAVYLVASKALSLLEKAAGP